MGVADREIPVPPGEHRGAREVIEAESEDEGGDKRSQSHYRSDHRRAHRHRSAAVTRLEREPDPGHRGRRDAGARQAFGDNRRALACIKLTASSRSRGAERRHAGARAQQQHESPRATEQDKGVE